MRKTRAILLVLVLLYGIGMPIAVYRVGFERGLTEGLWWDR